jgi:hypothetical protein
MNTIPIPIIQIAAQNGAVASKYANNLSIVTTFVFYVVELFQFFQQLEPLPVAYLVPHEEGD